MQSIPHAASSRFTIKIIARMTSVLLHTQLISHFRANEWGERFTSRCRSTVQTVCRPACVNRRRSHFSFEVKEKICSPIRVSPNCKQTHGVGRGRGPRLSSGASEREISLFTHPESEPGNWCAAAADPDAATVAASGQPGRRQSFALKTGQ